MKPQFKVGSSFRQCVGIDVAKQKFDACISMYDMVSGDECATQSVQFPNTKTGYNQLMKWVRKEAVKGHPISFLMEPTGIYHENLAFHLHKLKQTIYIELPTKARDFARYSGIKTKTDRMDAYVLSLMGCVSKSLRPWQPVNPVYRELRQLTRFRDQLTKLKVSVSNNMEAVTHTYEPAKAIVGSCQDLILKFEEDISGIDQRIMDILEQNPDIYRKVKLASTIKGVGVMTVVCIIAETNGFEFITNRRQLASYAGLDVVARQSGPVDPAHKISKKGNAHIRQALYMPAISACRCNPQQKKLYDRILEKHQGESKIARTAVMRKLLLLIYTLWNSGEEYDPAREETFTTKKNASVDSTDGKEVKKPSTGKDAASENEVKEQADAPLHQLDGIVWQASDFPCECKVNNKSANTDDNKLYYLSEYD